VARGSAGASGSGLPAEFRAQGHEVSPATLIGIRERAHLARPEIDLDSQIADIVNLMTWEDLAEVVLVGHSYAGIVVTGVADRVGDRLAHVVYCESAPFGDGERMLAVMPPEAREESRERVERDGESWRIPPLPFADLQPSRTLEGLTAADRQLIAARSVTQSFATSTQPLPQTKRRPASRRSRSPIGASSTSSPASGPCSPP
jgi:pimeloyl-ACP methyl ester carboxylesterase